MERYFIGTGNRNLLDAANWSLTSGGAPYQPTVGTETISNGDFESGLIGTIVLGTGQTATWTLNTVNPISGTQDGLLEVTVAGTSSARPSLRFGTGRVVNTWRRISFKYKVNSGSCVLQYIHDGSGLIVINQTLTGSGTYTSPYFHTNGTSQAYLYFSNNVMNVQIDDISEIEYECL